MYFEMEKYFDVVNSYMIAVTLFFSKKLGLRFHLSVNILRNRADRKR